MKKVILFLLSVLAINFGILSTASADRWQWIYSDDKDSYYFDTQTIKRERGYQTYNLINMWVEDRSAYPKNDGTKYQKVNFTFDKNAYDYKISYLIKYDENYKTIYSKENRNIRWVKIPPESLAELFLVAGDKYLSDRGY